jgi:hypothetical protein
MTGFDATVQTSIKNVMQVVIDRFFSRAVHLNTTSVATKWMHGNGYFEKTKLPENNRQRADLLYAQKLALNTVGVPVINFTAKSQAVKYWAFADPGTVVTVFGTDPRGRTTVRVTGEFNVTLNTYWLSGAGRRLRAEAGDANTWGGVVAHEMLHGLGHAHGMDEYGDHLQINSCMQAVRTNGTHRGGRPCPEFG